MLAVADGTVFSGRRNRVGGTTRVSATGTQRLYYAHLGAFLFCSLRSTAACGGDVVGFVGNTDAEMTAYHLHLRDPPGVVLFLGYAYAELVSVSPRLAAREGRRLPPSVWAPTSPRTTGCALAAGAILLQSRTSLARARPGSLAQRSLGR